MAVSANIARTEAAVGPATMNAASVSLARSASAARRPPSGESVTLPVTPTSSRSNRATARVPLPWTRA